MSRSYKKSSVCKQSADQTSKRKANKRIRRTKDIPNGSSYKKCYESWDISDWGWWRSRQDAIDDWNEALNRIARGKTSYLVKRFKTLEQYLAYWEKCTRRK